MAKLMKKVLIIKGFQQPTVPDNFEEAEWRKLETALIAILNSETPSQSYEELYRTVENLHTCNYRLLLHENLHELLENDLIKKVDQLNFLEDRELLLGVDRLWKEFCRQIVLIKNIFLYFDRSSKNGKYNTIQFMSFNLFKTHVVSNPYIKRCLTNGLVTLIERERNGEEIDVILVKSLIDMLIELQVYDDIFQSDFVKSSEAYYNSEGEFYVKELPVKDYLQHVSKRISEEQRRAQNYLDSTTGATILDTIYKHLIKDHLAEILDKGFEAVLENNREDMALMYTLVKKVPSGLKKLIEYFRNYVSKKGLEVVNNQDNEKNMIQDLLDFKDRLDNIIEMCLGDDEPFHQTVKSTFSKFINIRPNKPAQLLAKFIDNKLRCKEIEDNELEAVLNKVMVLFRFIQGKDIFEAFYKRDLAKRLLLGKSTSQDAEDSMISKLKLECGTNFTSKIEGMFNDINVSRSINASFRHYLSNNVKNDNARASSDIFINVLQNSSWPNYPTFEVNLPAELANYQVIFTKFYTANHNGRKLFWQPNLGHCVVKAAFETGNKELQVSLFQTLVLLLFNESSQITFREIQESTNLELNELKRTLISLSCGKSRVLVKQPKGVDIGDQDIFYFNSKFMDKLFRVRINQIQLKETIEEEQATEKSVMVDRQFQIDAAIVRIMKNKKMIHHNALISELFDVLDIPVKPSDLKKRIELLIERDYMERDKDNASLYLYLA